MDAQSRENIRNHVGALPEIEEHDASAYIIDGDESRSLFAELHVHQSAIPVHLEVQVDFVLDEVIQQLNTTPDGNRYIVSKNDVRQALVRMAIRSSAQSLYDVSEILRQSHELENLLVGAITD